MSKKRSSAASTSFVSAFTLARPDVDPIELPICAARNAASSSNSAADSRWLPPARIWLPVRPASPVWASGSRYSPVRTRTLTVTSGSVWSSTTNATVPFDKVLRCAAESGGSKTSGS